MKDRSYYQRANAKLNPDTDYLQIFQNLTFHDFPWDMNQALNLALFRTYGVPSIGSLLLRTRQLTEHTQKRYDDPGKLARTLVRGALRLRAEVVKSLPPKESVAFFSEGNVKSYPNGFRIEELGTFKHPKPGEAGLNGAGLNGAGPNLGAGCPFPHGMTGAQDGHKGAEA